MRDGTKLHGWFFYRGASAPLVCVYCGNGMNAGDMIFMATVDFSRFIPSVLPPGAMVTIETNRSRLDSLAEFEEELEWLRRCASALPQQVNSISQQIVSPTRSRT